MPKKKLESAYYDSQASAAGALSIDISLIRDAKRAGCSAFKSGRVHKAELGRWFQKHPPKIQPTPNADGKELAKSHWDREHARVDYERAQFALDVAKRKYVPLDEICGAVGQMLAGFRTAINMLPASAARWLVGLKDFHAIRSKLQSEVDGVLHSLGRCRYLEDLAPTVIDRLLKDRPRTYRDDVEKIVSQVFVELGRECFTELQIDFGEPPAKTTDVSHAAPDSE